MVLKGCTNGCGGKPEKQTVSILAKHACISFTRIMEIFREKIKVVNASHIRRWHGFLAKDDYTMNFIMVKGEKKVLCWNIWDSPPAFCPFKGSGGCLCISSKIGRLMLRVRGDFQASSYHLNHSVIVRNDSAAMIWHTRIRWLLRRESVRALIAVIQRLRGHVLSDAFTRTPLSP